MATINQSPAGQTTVTLSGISLNGITGTTSPYWESTKIVQGGSFALSGISLNGITATASPTWRSRKLVQGGSFAVSFSGETPAPPPLAIPTTGQIWPLGFV
jgi:hypothetical protein